MRINKKTMYYFLVMTSPEKQFHNIETLLNYLNTLDFYIMISEQGENGDNPHLNVIVKSVERLDNLKRKLMSLYYGDKLQEFTSKTGFKINGAKGKIIKTEFQLQNVLVYLHKESSEHYYSKGINMEEIISDKPTYEEHKQIQEQSQHVNMTLDKLLDMAIERYIINIKSLGLNKYIKDEIPPPQRYDFHIILTQMSKEKINCMPIYKNLQPFFIQFMSQLGNYDYIESVVERLHEKLTIKKE